MGGRLVSKPDAVIFDMDGTLCDVTSIRHHVLTRPKNFDAFHHGSIFCPPNDWVADELRAHAVAGRRIIVVTAREEKWRTLTANWLAHNRIFWDQLLMRPTGDFRSDVLIKGEILAVLRKSYDIVHAYDDNPAIIDLWESEGIPTTTVPGWAEERV